MKMKKKLQKLNDPHDGNILVIHPEVKDFVKYNKLSKENLFPMEMTFNDLEKIDYKDITNWLAIHGSNKLTFESFLNELDKAEFYNVLYIVFHETTLLNIFNENTIDVIKWYNINILVENTSLDIEKFNESYNFLKTKIIWLKKCIDLWHANLHNSNINDWFDQNVLTAHIHNNYWKKDSHYSLWRGTIDYSKLKNKLKSIKYISLETDVWYYSYVKNIIYIIKKQLISFSSNSYFLNTDIYQKEIISKLRQLFKWMKNIKISYAFLYWSFVKKKCKKNSDLDLFLCLEWDFNLKNKNNIIKKYNKFCLDFWFTIDKEYPIEIFYISDIVRFSGSWLSSDDKEEIIKSHSMKNRFIIWDKNKFNFCKKHIIYGEY